MRYEAFMDGVALSSIDPRLIILDIMHIVSTPAIQTAEPLNRNGSIRMQESMAGSSVTISFELHIYDIAERQRVCQEVARWANGSVLTTNDRNGQRLFVKCTNYPFISSALKWTAPLTMTFTAFEHPFWEEDLPSMLTLTGDDEESTLYVPGNAGKTLVSAIITPAATLQNIALSVGNTAITLTGIGAETTDTVVISYDDHNFLSIKKGSTSLLSKRTGSDDLLAECGQVNEVSFTSSANAEVVFSARGLWL